MGLQTLDRAISVLQALASGGEDGLRLIDLQHSLNLTKPTAHRLLAALVSHGLVAHDGNGRRYRLGRELAILGWSVARRQQELRSTAMHSASLLAEETGDTVVVVVRSGLDTVCIDRRTGAYPVKALTVDIGTRRPIVVGAGGLAMLASLPPAECDGILQTVADRLPIVSKASPGQILAAVREARRTGYAVSNGFVTEGVRGISVAIRDFRSEPIAAIGIAAIMPRIPARRIPELARSLDLERRRIESRLLASHLPAHAPANGDRSPRRHKLR
jgi:DNA-binding IclR family transcriptional regulator